MIPPTNVSANITQSTSGIQQSSERIGSGRRINGAADDAAGLVLSNRLTSQINGFSQSVRNGNDGISLLQTADGALTSINDSLQQIRELALQAGNGTLNDSDRQAINAEAQQLREEISRTVESTQFNGQSLLNRSEDLSIQLGSNTDDSVSVGVGNVAQFLEDAGFENLDLSSSSGASEALNIVNESQASILGAQANVGGQSNRIDSSINSLLNSQERAAESRSRIEDANIAREVSELSADRVRRDISIALLAQANSDRDNVLRLLGNT